jgi:hypothetical protein
MATIRRRLGALEKGAGWPSPGEYDLLTPPEVEDIARRAREGETITRVELSRIERQSPISQGEILMTCHHGQLWVKRYIGINLAEL